jgi:hypothetical protein
MKVIYKGICFQPLYIVCDMTQHTVLLLKLCSHFVTEYFVPTDVFFHSSIHTVNSVHCKLGFSRDISLLECRFEDLL